MDDATNVLLAKLCAMDLRVDTERLVSKAALTPTTSPTNKNERLVSEATALEGQNTSLP